jgi:hypothetical protein
VSHWALSKVHIQLFVFDDGFPFFGKLTVCFARNVVILVEAHRESGEAIESLQGGWVDLFGELIFWRHGMRKSKILGVERSFCMFDSIFLFNRRRLYAAVEDCSYKSTLKF